jgi:glycerol-3-phosphate dehydrogenase (NAD(P)+)
MRVAILGAGAWGTALGMVVSQNGHEVLLWGHRPEQLQEMERTRQNERYLPGIDLKGSWHFVPEIKAALESADLVFLALPSKAFREVAKNLEPWERPIISVTKGIEYETGMTMTQVLGSCAPRAPVAALSGPTFAIEVAQNFPVAIVAASNDDAIVKQVQSILHRNTFRVYTTADLIGVELGGALKNVIALAAGLGDALGFGDSSKAALVTRALAEIRRLGVACGAQPETFAGLSGLGDLTLTCFSQLSRNRRFGERLARGESVERILATSHIVEGYPTARAGYKLARKMNVETPIIDEVYALLYEEKNLRDCLRDLTTRESKAED